MDQMNGVSILDNTITGGTLGNGIDIGASHVVYISGTKMEVCNGYGIRVAGDTNPGNGLCSVIRIEGNYTERISKPFSLGEAYIVRGAKLCTNGVGNSTTTGIDDPEYVIRLGRVSDVEISGNSCEGSGGMDEPFVKIVRVAAGGVTEIPVNCRIVDNWFTGVSDNYVLEGMPNVGYNSRVMSYNVMKYGSEPPTGITRVYTSPVITTANAATNRAWQLATDNGGNVDKIEVFDVTGDIDGQLNIGSTSSIVEIKAVNLATLSFTNGAVSLAPSVPMMRPGLNSIMNVSSMTESGSFRVRIHYRN